MQRKRRIIFFGLATFFLAVLVYGWLGGVPTYTVTVNRDGEGIVLPGEGVLEFAAGSVLELKAEPHEGWEFGGWVGDLRESRSNLQMAVNSDLLLGAVFLPKEYSVSVALDGEGLIDVNPRRERFMFGDIVEIRALGSAGWQFSGWSGDLAQFDTEVAEVLISDNIQAVASFSERQFSVDIEVEGNGRVSMEPSKDSYVYGDSLRVEVSGDVGWQFSGWRGDLAKEQAPSATITITDDIASTARFEPKRHALSIGTQGSGSIVSSPRQETYQHNDQVELRATASDGWVFREWTGDLSGRENPTRVTVGKDMRVQAVFERLSILRQGDSGPEVRQLQDVLAQMGFLPTGPDGQFGLQTRLAVKKAQQYLGLAVDGVAGPSTWNALLNANSDAGALYTVQSGDTLWSLSQRWGTSVDDLVRINELSNPDSLRLGQRLRVPGSLEGREVEDLHWNTVDRLFPRHTTALITDVETGYSFRLYRHGGTNHADVEFQTAADTAVARQLYGSWSWDRRAVIVHLGDRLVAASMNGYPHGGQSIHDNNFPGHVCLHFRGSTLHLNGSLDRDHQERVEKAADVHWPLLDN